MRTFTSFDELSEARSARTSAPATGSTIEQERVDQFADATGDHQWIHVDVERAARGPLRRHHRPRLPDAVADPLPRRPGLHPRHPGRQAQLRRQQGALPQPGPGRLPGPQHGLGQARSPTSPPASSSCSATSSRSRAPTARSWTSPPASPRPSSSSSPEPLSCGFAHRSSWASLRSRAQLDPDDAQLNVRGEGVAALLAVRREAEALEDRGRGVVDRLDEGEAGRGAAGVAEPLRDEGAVGAATAVGGQDRAVPEAQRVAVDGAPRRGGGLAVDVGDVARISRSSSGRPTDLVMSTTCASVGGDMSNTSAWIRPASSTPARSSHRDDGDVVGNRQVGVDGQGQHLQPLGQAQAERAQLGLGVSGTGALVDPPPQRRPAGVAGVVDDLGQDLRERPVGRRPLHAGVVGVVGEPVVVGRHLGRVDRYPDPPRGRGPDGTGSSVEPRSLMSGRDAVEQQRDGLVRRARRRCRSRPRARPAPGRSEPRRR